MGRVDLRQQLRHLFQRSDNAADQLGNADDSASCHPPLQHKPSANQQGEQIGSCATQHRNPGGEVEPVVDGALLHFQLLVDALVAGGKGLFCTAGFQGDQPAGQSCTSREYSSFSVEQAVCIWSSRLPSQCGASTETNPMPSRVVVMAGLSSETEARERIKLQMTW